MKIVFMGSADFGIPALEQLLSEKYTIAGIVTTPSKPQGRGLRIEDSPVAKYASTHGLQPVLAPINLKDVDFIHSLISIDADLFVVIAYRILPLEVIQIPRLGAINVHASLLPKYRGPAPIQRAIEAGETITGVSVFQINRGVDTGKILLQKEAAIGETETTPQLYQRLSNLGAQALIEACKDLREGIFQGVEQDTIRQTHAPKLKKEESLIDWSLPARTIFNKIRAFKPFPGTHTILNGKQVGIEWAEPVDTNSMKPQGSVCKVCSDFFEVQCGDGILRILEVQPSGKKRMTAGAFLCGTKISEGTTLS